MTEQHVQWMHNCPGVIETEIVDGAIQVTCIVEEEGPQMKVDPNLVPNWSFEDGDLSMWDTYTDSGAPTFLFDSTVAYHGDVSGSISGASLNDQGRIMTSRNLPVIPAEILYRLTGRMMGEFTEGEPRVKVTFWTESMGYLGGKSAMPLITPDDEDWIYSELNGIIAPDGAAFARFECHVMSGINGTVWFDALEFGPQVEEELTIEEVMLAAGAESQLIKLNPGAALQKVINADGFQITGNEFDQAFFDSDTSITTEYVGQRAERLSDGIWRTYYVVKGDWENVVYVQAEPQ